MGKSRFFIFSATRSWQTEARPDFLRISKSSAGQQVQGRENKNKKLAHIACRKWTIEALTMYTWHNCNFELSKQSIGFQKAPNLGSRNLSNWEEELLILNRKVASDRVIFCHPKHKMEYVHSENSGCLA